MTTGFVNVTIVNIIKNYGKYMERCKLDSVPGDEAFARFRLKENDRLPAVMRICYTGTMHASSYPGIN